MKTEKDVVFLDATGYSGEANSRPSTVKRSLSHEIEHLNTTQPYVTQLTEVYPSYLIEADLHKSQVTAFGLDMVVYLMKEDGTFSTHEHIDSVTLKAVQAKTLHVYGNASPDPGRPFFGYIKLGDQILDKSLLFDAYPSARIVRVLIRRVSPTAGWGDKNKGVNYCLETPINICEYPAVGAELGYTPDNSAVSLLKIPDGFFSTGTRTFDVDWFGYSQIGLRFAYYSEVGMGSSFIIWVKSIAGITSSTPYDLSKFLPIAFQNVMSYLFIVAAQGPDTVQFLDTSAGKQMEITLSEFYLQNSIPNYTLDNPVKNMYLVEILGRR